MSTSSRELNGLDLMADSSTTALDDIKGLLETFEITTTLYMKRCVCRCVMDVWMDGWMDACMDGCMHGCLDAWMHGCMNA